MFRLSESERTAAVALARAALQEDLAGAGDLTTRALVPAGALAAVRVVPRKPGILSGSELLALVFQEVDPAARVDCSVADGALLEPGREIARIAGPAGSLLTGERTALNFLTFLSGIATLTSHYVAAVAGSSARIFDTRKTLPGLRWLQKYAVRCGGGDNHRSGLYDAVLIKDNHLAFWTGAAGGTLATAVRTARRFAPAASIEIEVDSLAQLEEALPAGPDIVLLDNMSLGQLTRAVEIRDRLAKGVALEASGGITLETVGAVARCGVDRISVGALTHSAPALDIGFDWE